MFHDGRCAEVADRASGTSVQHARFEGERKRVLIATAVVTVKANNDDEFVSILDSASEINFIKLAVCKRLNIKLDEMCESINGLNNISCAINHDCRILIKSRCLIMKK